LLFFLFAHTIIAGDLESQFKSISKGDALAKEKSDKVKKDAVLIKCGYDEGWGNKIYILNGELYKSSTADDRIVQKYATFKAGSKAEWKQKFGSFPEYISSWQLVQISQNSYKVYMTSPGAPIAAADCSTK
jgi:hypothetical protein